MGEEAGKRHARPDGAVLIQALKQALTHYYSYGNYGAVLNRFAKDVFPHTALAQPREGEVTMTFVQYVPEMK